MNIFRILFLIYWIRVSSSNSEFNLFEEIKLKQAISIFYKLGDICKIYDEKEKKSNDVHSQCKYYIGLYEAGNFTEYNVFDAADKILDSPNFDVTAKTIIFLQGFRPNPFMKEALIMQKEFAQVEKFNFLLCYYKTNLDMNSYDAYFRIATLTKHFGKQLADFLANFIKKGVRVDDLYLITYSLGVQIGAYAARILRDEQQWILPRITAMDPAAICFVNGLLPSLNHRDAHFVDIIHTSITSYTGNFEGRGHADFIINSKLGALPECGTLYVVCNHVLVLNYYIKSINNYTELLATQCLNDKCTSVSTSYMGFRANSTAKGFYYLKVKDPIDA